MPGRVSGMARLLRFAAVAVLLGGVAAGVSGCTGDADPVVSVSPSVTAEVTPTPTVSPSPTPLSEEELLELIPENAREENFGSAVNFAQFFLSLYPEMMQTKDSRVFAYLSDDACVFCQNALESRDELVTANGSVTGGEMTFDAELASGGLEPDGTWNASFDVTTHEAIHMNATGEVTETVPERSGRLGVSLQHDGDHWTVLGVGSGAA